MKKTRKEPSTTDMDRKLTKAVAEIKAEAAGRTCGGCIHYLDSECLSQINIEGNPLKIYSDNAIACKLWEENA